jgi:DNA repair protein RadC
MTKLLRHRRQRPVLALYHSTIKDWPEGERPREKMMQKGADSLTQAELLAILIRTGTKGTTALDLAKGLLTEGRTLRDLAAMAPADFQAFGIGPARATSIVAAFELARRERSEVGDEKPIFRVPSDVAKKYSSKFRDLKHEEFWALLLNSANRLIAERRVTSGTLNTSLVHPRECFKAAIRESAASVIFLHNHPSGNPEPSAEDLSITKQLVESGKILGIPVHDHIILAGTTFTSFAERGLL